MSKILLVDGNAMLFRAYYASKYVRRMTTSNGIPTNAVYGFISMFKKAVELLQPQYVCVAWDAGKPTFRHKAYDAYKGTRKELDEDLIVQMPIIREYLDRAHIFRYEQEGIEADDIIGTLSKMYPDHETVILSSDRDLLQLIDDSTSVLLMKKGISEMHLVDEKECLESFGVTPSQIIELKGLMGDASDNIPGVKGVGEKTALQLLHSYGSVQGVYEHLDEIKGKLKEKLAENKETAELSLYLATIVRDAKLDMKLEDCLFQIDDAGQNEFLRKYEMKSLLVEVKKNDEVHEKNERRFEVVDYFSILKDGVSLALDVDQEEAGYANIYGIALCDGHVVEYMEWDQFLKDEKAKSFLAGNASKSVYDFSEYISRFAHSLTTALLTYKVTQDKTMTVAALFHDVATPCFSHVIDYMNEDYEKQESTEELTEDIIKNDKYLLKCLKEDNIDVDDVINFKKFSIVDNDRPKCCADRLDGVILTGIGWTKNISEEDIKNIIIHFYFLTIY